MSRNIAQDKFYEIPVPDELENAVKAGLRKGKKRRAFRHALSGTAAAVAIVFMTANIPFLYVRATELPLLAPLVRVMRVGSGGECVSGAVPHIRTGSSRVLIDFTNGGGETVPVPVFSAVQRKAPRRVTLRLHGLAGELSLEGVLMSQKAVSDAYPVSATDPAEKGVTFHLKPGWNCAIGQYENALELQFSQGEAEESTGCYSLRSAPMPQGQELARLTETLLWEGATQLKLPSGEYCVVLGEFAAEQQAEKARSYLCESHGVDLDISRFPGETE